MKINWREQFEYDGLNVMVGLTMLSFCLAPFILWEIVDATEPFRYLKCAEGTGRPDSVCENYLEVPVSQCGYYLEKRVDKVPLKCFDELGISK